MRRVFAGLLGSIVACGPAMLREIDDDDTAADASDEDATTTPADPDAGTIVGDDAAREAAAPLTPDKVDPNAPACDDGLAVDGDIDQFLRAINLCQRTTADDIAWGVIEASFSRDIGRGTRAPAPMQHGILPKYGDVITPRHGSALGVLSTGWAREYNGESGQKPFQEGAGSGLGVGEVPDEFGGYDADAFDLINVRLSIRVPSNARGFSFDFDFFTSEWPHYAPSEYNDRFVVWLTDSAHPNGANISFDSQNRPVSVNLGFFDRCVDGASTGCSGSSNRTASCPAGISELGGTGFGLMGVGCKSEEVTKGGATGWLTTRVPAVGGEIISLEFAIWDEHDTNRDSLVLLDHFRWEADPVQNPGTTRPPS